METSAMASKKSYASLRKACWKGYEAIGVKEKSGRTVPNCVPVKEEQDQDPREYDYEGDMAMSDLRSIMYNAQRLHDMMEKNTNLPEWLQSKITKAEDYISSATNYMQAQMNEELGPENDMGTPALTKKLLKLTPGQVVEEEEKKNLNKPFLTPGGPKKRSVYVKDPGTGNVKKVNFGDTTGLTIKTSDPDRRRNFRARHNCDTPGPKTKARYWSCKAWSADTVKKGLGENFQDGRNPEDKGDMARHGLKGKTLNQLKQVRGSDTASPRAKQLAHWFINMNKNKN
jgi:hypothetical protein